ncbi:MAG: 50S ribosomal protein L25 [Tissierella sp.]|nr:50S ribosomal protein L25 [Tissierella sp.]
MSSIKMKIESRENIGSNKVNKLRADSTLPGVIYKRGSETLVVQVSEKEFTRAFKLAGTTNIIDLDLNGEVHPVIVKDIQRHPVKNQILHVDFQELNMNETIKMFIPVNLINRDSIKLQPSILAQMLDQVEIECLPNHIPNSADVDVADMTFTDPLYVKDLDVANNDDVTVLTDLDTLVCTLSEPSAVVEEETDGESDEAVETGTEETEE